MLRHVDHEPHIAVGHGGQNEPGLQPGQPRHTVRPWVEPVPNHVQVIYFRVRKARDRKILQDLEKIFPMQGVEIGEPAFPVTYTGHGRHISPAPGQGESLSIQAKALVRGKTVYFRSNTVSPVNNSPKHIKKKRFYHRHLNFHSLGIFPYSGKAHPVLHCFLDRKSKAGTMIFNSIGWKTGK